MIQSLNFFLINFKENPLNLETSSSQVFQTFLLIFLDHLSYIDLIYFYLKFSPVFTCVEFQDEKLILSKKSFLEFFKIVCFGSKKNSNSSSLVKLSELMKESKKKNIGPILLFPEGSTTNGKSILKFQPIFDENFETTLKQENLNIHVIGIRYQFSHFSPCFHLDDFYSHLYHLLGQVYNQVRSLFHV
jgi:hypothetical protein